MLTFVCKMIHIGRKIHEVIKAKGISVSVFAKKINKSRTVVYDIFERESIDSLLLYKISEELDFNFLGLYDLSNKENLLANETTNFYGDGWKVKYMELLEKYNRLLEVKTPPLVLLTKAIFAAESRGSSPEWQTKSLSCAFA